MSKAETEAIDWYNENIAITEKLDVALSARSKRFARMPKAKRYMIIHKALGVNSIIELYKKYRT